MRSIQTTALVLWVGIFIVASFIIGQILASKDIFDVSGIITGQKKEESKENENTEIDQELENDISINKVGQETVRIGLNVAEEYFSNYYKEYINYVMGNSDSYPINEKILVNDMLASEYVFYAISNNLDKDKYISTDDNIAISIKESEINSFADKMFSKEIEPSFKKDGKYGYDKINKVYSIEVNKENNNYSQELQKIENITSNQLVLTYICEQKEDDKVEIKNKNTIKITINYKGGRYIVTEVIKED